MKTITTYQCEICGKTSTELEDIDKCEKIHVKDSKIIIFAWKKGFRYPVAVKIEFPEGKEITYTREGQILDESNL